MSLSERVQAKAEERRWITLNDNSGWRRIERRTSTGMCAGRGNAHGDRNRARPCIARKHAFRAAPRCRRQGALDQ